MLCAVRRRAGIKWGRCKKLECRVTAVLVAAGSSTRMGFDKLSFDLGGETVLERSVRAFDECPEVDELVIVTGASSENAQRAVARCKKPVRLVKGGSTRAESARSGVAAAHGKLVAVHDAALREPERYRRYDSGRCPLRCRRPCGAGEGHHQAGEGRKRQDCAGRLHGGEHPRPQHPLCGADAPVLRPGRLSGGAG